MEMKLSAKLPFVGKLGISTGELSCSVNGQYPIQFKVKFVYETTSPSKLSESKASLHKGLIHKVFIYDFVKWETL